ncbi:MAG: ABC transporter permease, partial [Dehalococcoidia bacterium]
GFVGNEGLVTRLDTVQAIFGQEGEVDAIAISNSGGVRDGIELTDAVVASAERVIAEEGLDLDVEPFKQDAVDEAELVGNLMATLFLVFGLFAIAPGILLIVMIFVMLAAERKSEMGMARAVGTKRGQLVQTFMSEGMAYNLGAAAVGAALGILVSLGITQLMARIFSEFGLSIQPHVTLRSLVISYSLGVVLTFATVTFASWRISKLNIVRAIRDIPEPTGGRMGWRSVAVALAAIALGALLFVTGMANDSQFPFALGFSLIVFGAAIVLRFFRLPDRPVFTAMGLLLLLLWGLVAGHRQEFLFGELEGDIEMFFLSGIVVVAASTFVLIYNADLMLAVVSRLGGRFGRILPAMKTAVAYPLASKFRTGMTLAMISLVIFALTIMFGLSAYFDRIALSDEARGGWDVLVQENANNPIEPDLTQALAGSIDVSQFRAVGRVDIPHRFTVPEVRNVGDGEFDTYPVRGVDRAFLEGGDIQLEARAVGFESDRQVWVALRDNPKFAVVDFLAVQHDPFDESKFRIEGIDEGDDTFERVTIEVRDPVSSQTAEVEVIGVISLGSSSPAAFLGIYVPEETFNQLFGEAEFSHYYVGLNDPGRAGELAKSIEAALLTSGAQASSIKEDIEDEQALQRNFFRLIQGFMGLGLFVGIAAVGVISFRTVVERRQQIGVLRAIGYSRGMVSLSFLLESTFVTALGILSGIGLAIWLSYFLISGNEFSTSDVGYVIPWVEILFISAFAFFASLVMTIVPSRRAASIPPAEALRYE